MICPVYVDGKPQLYDIFTVDGVWLGSQRTFCKAYGLLHSK
jgi:hypothetical protein